MIVARCNGESVSEWVKELEREKRKRGKAKVSRWRGSKVYVCACGCAYVQYVCGCGCVYGKSVHAWAYTIQSADLCNYGSVHACVHVAGHRHQYCGHGDDESLGSWRVAKTGRKKG